VAEQVARLERISRSRLRVVYNGIDGLEAPFPYRQALQPEHGSDSHECRTVRICLLANVRRIKRIEDFLRAAAQLKKSCLTSEFLVIGHPIDAGYQHELDALIDDLGLATRVRFVSDLKESLQLLNTCDIGVLTSESEGLSNSILEYMRAELPVVCSNTGGNPELVTDGENGFTYPVGDFAQLAARLEHLCMDDAKRRVMGRASWKNAARFTVAAMTDFHLGIYRELGCSNSSRE
jgi:glycosyltransferase involved in cell wall biosynthesis